MRLRAALIAAGIAVLAAAAGVERAGACTCSDVDERDRLLDEHGQAAVGGRVFGTDRFLLRALHLPSGRKRTVATLPDRGTVDLEGVAGTPPIGASRRRPELGYEVLRPRPG